MTISLTATTKVGVLAWHVDDDKVRVQIGAAHVDLDQEQRKRLAAYLTAEDGS